MPESSNVGSAARNVRAALAWFSTLALGEQALGAGLLGEAASLVAAGGRVGGGAVASGFPGLQAYEITFG